MKRPVYDWIALRAEFAAGNESLTKFAAGKGISLSTLKERATRDEWERARSTFRTDAANKTLTKKAEFRARSEAEIDNRMHVIADNATEIIKARLERIKAGKEKASGMDLKLLTDALANSYGMQRLTAGLPKQKVPDRVQVENVESKTGVVELPKLKDE